MHFGTSLKFTAASAFLAFAAAPALGAAYTASTNGSWFVASTWGGAGVPGSSDTATIPYDVTVTIVADNPNPAGAAAISSLTIASSAGGTNPGKLVVNNGSLTIYSTSVDTVINAANVAGIVMNHPNSLLTFQASAGTRTISGVSTAFIDMADPGALITVPSGVQFDLETIGLHGEGQVDGSGTFHLASGASVVANQGAGGAAATLDFGSSLVLDDDSGTLWMATGASSVLQFSKAVSTLAGNFEATSSGKLYIFDSVVTSGSLKLCGSGSIQVVGSETFTYGSWVTFTDSCDNPVVGSPPFVLSGADTWSCASACP